MIDALLYIRSFTALIGYLDTHHPELLARDEDGNLTDPPTVTGLTRTPAVADGDEMIVYVRLPDDKADQWRGMPDVTVLAETPWQYAPGQSGVTADALKAQVESDPDKLAIWSSMIPQTPYTDTDPETHETYTVEPTFWGSLGVMAGA